MGKQKVYPPLALVKSLLPEIEACEIVLDQKQSFDKGTELERIVDFLYAKYENELPAFTQKYGEEGLNIFAYSVYERSVAVMTALHWRRYKQAYSFSKDLCDMLMEMEDFEMSGDIFDNLPYEAFYLELENNELAEGILVKYSKNPVRNISITPCVRKISNQSLHSFLVELPDAGSYREYFAKEAVVVNGDASSPDLEIFRKVVAFVIQACMYLCAKNADITENPEHKKIYRPFKSGQDKYSAIRKWDVGVKVVREHKKATRTNNPSVNLSERQRPRQHWRRAHWHTYRTGVGRTEKVLRFVPPALVNGNGDEFPVIVHQ